MTQPGRFQLEVCEDHEDMSARAAELIAREVRANPAMLFCAATGSTPTRMYELLVDRGRREAGLFDRIRVLKLDEWGGLDSDDPGTCEMYLRRHFTGPLDIPDERFFGFRSDADDPDAECGRVRQALETHGPIGLCLLGIGANGHLGLNEPAEELQPHSHVAGLREESIQHPMLRGSRRRPASGLTLGMADILRSHKILLLVSGAHKREIMQRLFSSPISTHLPASFLKLHPNAVCLGDREAVG